jgi:PPOX class probable F420-dependent enzyme
MAKLSDNARKLIEGKNFAFVGTVNRDGSPHVTTTWVDTDGEYVYVNTAIGRMKQRNTKREPRVWVTVVDIANPYNQVMIKGRVDEQITGQQAEDHIDKMAKKYTGNEKYTGRQAGEKRVLLKIKPEKEVGR